MQLPRCTVRIWTYSPSCHNNLRTLLPVWTRPTTMPFWRAPLRIHRHGSRMYASDVQYSEKNNVNCIDEAKPITHMPGPSKVRTLWEVVLTNKYVGKRHALWSDRCAEFGPVYKEFLLGQNAVTVSDPEAVGLIMRLEGRLPRRIVIDAWRQCRDHLGFSRGIFTQDGEEWWRWRKVLNQQMMKPAAVSSYTGSINDVADDFITRLHSIRDEHGVASSLPDLRQELFNWSLESICSILFERRFGCFGEVEPEIHKIIQGVVDVMESTEVLLDYPYKLARFVKPREYKKHNQGFHMTLSHAKIIIDKKVEEIRAAATEDNKSTDGFLSRLLASKGLTNDEVYGNVMELMGGAVDTTSTAMLWTIYYLSRNPGVQEMLAHEIEHVLPGKKTPCYDDLARLPYIKAILKETLRLSPPAYILSRYVPDDTDVLGYTIPGNTLVIIPIYTMGHDAKLFPNPEEFHPERWLRQRNRKEIRTIQSFSSIPFGFGPRMCIGRKISELEIYLLLVKLIQNFVIEPATGEKITAQSAGVLQPSRPVKVRLLDRT